MKTKNAIYVIVAVVLIGAPMIYMFNTILWQLREMTALQQRVYNLEVVVNHKIKLTESAKADSGEKRYSSFSL